jgi:hypothetical protein
MSRQISQYITYAEATKSNGAVRHGIKNDPNPEELSNMEYVATQIFDKLRKAMHDKYGKPLAVTSFFRSKELNALTPGSSKTSQHMTGEAIDIDADVFGGPTNREIFGWIKANCTFDQLIWEYGDDNNPAWVHVSLSRRKNRNQIIRVRK